MLLVVLSFVLDLFWIIVRVIVFVNFIFFEYLEKRNFILLRSCCINEFFNIFEWVGMKVVMKK